MSAVRTGILVSAADKYASQAIAIATMAIMSRILTPAETGLYLIANTVILLADNLRAFGVGIYIVQERDLTRHAVRSAFTVTLVMSLCILIAIVGSSGPIARYYGEPTLQYLLIVAAGAFAVIPFGSATIAMLQRDLAFGALACINVSGALIGAVVTVGLGAAGFGPVSYIWGFVVTSAVLSGLAFLFRPDAWIFCPSLVGARRILSFGAVSCSVTVVNMACEMLPRLAFGKLLGFDAVGLYARAITVCQLPDRAITSALQPVVLPAMAAQTRNGENLKETYLRGHSLMSAVQWPTLVMLALLADPIVRILLGSQWSEVPPLVRIIAIANMAMAPAFMTFPVLVAVGRIRAAFLSSLISLPPSAALAIFAAQFGLKAVALSLFVTAPFQMLVALVFIRASIGLTWKELVIASRASITITLSTALPPAIVILTSSNGLALDWLETALAVVGGAVGWMAALKVVEHPMRSEISAIKDIVAGRLTRRRTAAVLHID